MFRPWEDVELVEPVKLKVASARMLTDAIRELVFIPGEGAKLAGYTPGAHVKFQLSSGERSYSLIDFDEDTGQDGNAEYRFAVQLERQGAGGSGHMHGLAPGDEVLASGPHNDFPLMPGKPALLIAGGIGITPLIGMAAALKRAGTPFRFHYASRSSAAMAYLSELKATFGNQVAFHFDDQPETALDIDGLVASANPDEHVYICGPKGLIEAVKAKAETAGFAPDRVHFELFTSAAQQSGDTEFEVEVKSTGDVFAVPPGKSIIDVLEAAGLDLIHDCRRGDCGICQTDIIEGIPDHRDVVLSDSEKAEGKVMQICVSRAKSARLVLDL
ncbi:MAG: PDR/VanB family oxidoreductase [Hoeflea sp.]|uniref:PDR/VanB family oxidoreductase n=1 Tax=Hoeflea sp. TaxID=1940281 RepID=UPI003298F991